MIDKEPKIITTEDEAALDADASEYVQLLASRYPTARGIDLLNAFLKAFTRLEERTDR